MEVGIFAPLLSPLATGDYLETLGRVAESRGFESVWIPEHVVLFDAYESEYPYAEDGKIPVPATNGWLEPWTSLSFLAAATTTLRLGTGICILPQRNPVYAAKTIANVDFLSGGRVDVGIGVGWLAEEFQVVGVSFERRGARTDECIEVMRRLWCDELSEHKGEFYQVPACRMEPKPIQAPHPPLHVGGNSAPALRRAARLGQGWFGYQLTPGQAQASISQLARLLAAQGRARADLEVTICPGMLPLADDSASGYRDAGVDRLLLPTAAFDPSQLEAQLDALAKKVL